MANEKPPSPGSRRRRPPSVIDLQATEVPPEKPASAPEPQAEAAAPVSDPPSPPPPSPEPPRAETPPHPKRRSAFAWLPEELSWAQASAGITGAVAALLVVLLLWLAGAFSGGRDRSADLSPRLAAIEKQLNDLAARPQPASIDPKALNDIAARLSRLETAQAAPRPPVTDPVVSSRLSAAESAARSLADAQAASRCATSTAEIDRLAKTLAEVQDTARQAAAGSDRASRFAVAASALRNAVERGDPFSAELAIVRPLTTDAETFAALEPFAAAGVPGNTALGQELVGDRPPSCRRAEAPTPRDGGFLDRLQVSAEKLVRIRPVGEARGDDRDAVLARVEYAAATGQRDRRDGRTRQASARGARADARLARQGRRPQPRDRGEPPPRRRRRRGAQGRAVRSALR